MSDECRTSSIAEDSDTSGCNNSSQEFDESVVSSNPTGDSSVDRSPIVIGNETFEQRVANLNEDLRRQMHENTPSKHIKSVPAPVEDSDFSDLELTPRKPSLIRLTDGQIMNTLHDLTPVKQTANGEVTNNNDPSNGLPVPETVQKTLVDVRLSDDPDSTNVNTLEEHSQVVPSEPLLVSKPCKNKSAKPCPKRFRKVPVPNSSTDVHNGDILLNNVNVMIPEAAGSVAEINTSAMPPNSPAETDNTAKKRTSSSKPKKPAAKRKRSNMQATADITHTTVDIAAVLPTADPSLLATAPNNPVKATVGDVATVAPLPVTTPKRRGRPPKIKPKPQDVTPTIDPSPSATVPPTTVPPATVLPATVPPVTVPPHTVPPVTVPPHTVPPVTVPPLVPVLSEEMLPGYPILMELIKSSLSKPFLNRPNASIPGMDSYYSYISRPMWLLEVKRKFDKGSYHTLKEFAQDVRLIFENCYRFNGPVNWCTKKALRVEQLFEQKLATLPSHLASICSLNATHDLRKEDFQRTPEEIASSGNVYFSLLLAKIIQENRKKLAAEQPKVSTAVKPISLTELQKAALQAEREQEKDEIFKGMRLKIMETLSDKEIEQEICKQELPPKKLVIKKEAVKDEEEGDAWDDMIDGFLDENYVETEEDKRKREEREKKDLEWEDTNIHCGKNREYIRSMWELPEIGHFLCCALDVLNMEDIPLYELERMLLIPQASTTLAMLMTSLLSGHAQRQKLDKMPPMPYSVWTRRLYLKVQKWYKAYNKVKHEQQTVFDIDPQFWVILGPWNPLDEYCFHELTFHQRVWLVKALCDNCFTYQKTVTDLLVDLSYHDRDYRLLGNDSSGSQYFYLRPFCERDLRVYKEPLDPTPWQEKHSQHLRSEEEHSQHLRSEEEGHKKKRGRRKKEVPQEEPKAESTTLADPPDKTTKSSLSPKKGAKRKIEFKAVRRSTRNRVATQSYEDLDLNRPENDSPSALEQDCLTRLPTLEKTADSEQKANVDFCDTEENDAKGKCNKERIGATNVCNSDAESIGAESKCDIKHGGDAAVNGLDIKTESDIPVTCTCSKKQRCTQCSVVNITCDNNIAQDNAFVKTESDTKGDISRSTNMANEPMNQSLSTASTESNPTGRRPLQDAHWLAPDSDNFLLVADSVQSLRDLISSFTEEDMLLSTGITKNKTAKGKAAEENLVKGLNELLEDFQTFEAGLVHAANRSRYTMRRQWERFNTRSANYVDKNERVWLHLDDTKDDFENQTSAFEESEMAYDEVIKTEGDPSQLRACRARARSKAFLEEEEEVEPEYEEASHSVGEESDTDVWELPGSKPKKKKKAVPTVQPPQPSATPPTSPAPKKRKKRKTAVDSLASDSVDSTASVVPSTTSVVPSTTNVVPSKASAVDVLPPSLPLAEIIDLVDDDIDLKPLPPSRPRTVLQSKHAVKRSDFDPDIICLSDEDDLPPPLHTKVIDVMNDHPVRFGDIPHLLKGNQSSDKLNKFLQDTVTVYNQSEVKTGKRSGEKVVLLPSLNEKGEMVNVKKLAGQDAAKVLANKKNTQTRHILPSNTSRSPPSSNCIDIPSSQSTLKIVNVCSLNPRANEGPPVHTTPPKASQPFNTSSPPGSIQSRRLNPTTVQQNQATFLSPTQRQVSPRPQQKHMLSPPPPPRQTTLTPPRPRQNLPQTKRPHQTSHVQGISLLQGQSNVSPTSVPMKQNASSMPIIQSVTSLQGQTQSAYPQPPSSQAPQPTVRTYSLVSAQNQMSSSSSQKSIIPPEGHMVLTPEGNTVYLLQQERKPVISPPKQQMVTKRSISADKFSLKPGEHSLQGTSPKLQQFNLNSHQGNSTSPGYKQRVVPNSTQGQITPPRVIQTQMIIQQPQVMTQLSSPSRVITNTVRMVQQRQQQSPSVMQRVAGSPMQNQSPQPRLYVSYSPRQVSVNNANYIPATQAQVVYPNVSNSTTGIFQAFNSRQVVQQQTLQSYTVMNQNQAVINAGGQYAVMPSFETTAQAMYISQSTYVTSPVYNQGQNCGQTYVVPPQPAGNPVVTISDDSDEGGEITPSPVQTTQPKVVVIMDGNMAQYARVMPNGDRVILSPEEMAQLREANGGVLM